MSGYFEDPEATAKVLQDGLLWTGDLWLSASPKVFTSPVVRRTSSVVRGKNYYAEDVESCLERSDGVRGGGAVAFAIYDDERARDAASSPSARRRKRTRKCRAKMVEDLTNKVAEECGLSLEEVVLVRPGTIPKTSSGKRQRSLTREGATSPTSSP